MTYKSALRVICVVAVAFSSSIQQTTAQSTGQIKRAREQYNTISSTIFAENGLERNSPNPKGIDSRNIAAATNQLRELIKGQVTAIVTSGNVTAEKSLERVRLIQTHDLMSWGGTDVTNAPVVKPFTRGPTVGFAVAYTILRGNEAVPDSIGMLEFYAKQNGVWISAGIPESDFEGRTFVVSPIDSHRPDEGWYLVWAPNYFANQT